MFEPRIVGFLCNWCSYSGADQAGASRLPVPASFTPIRVMCSSRLDPVLILTAFLRGADGVLIAGCHPGDCHYDTGNFYTRRRQALLKDIVGELKLEEERLQLHWVSASEGRRFAEIVNAFDKRIRELGPSPLRTKVSV
ncbi:MAG TPA: hydrogenase iron-sulfur subunit [Methanomassiliicoccales archaeon]|nr:hydrogenase iron-sulfur subunit [Methanomassiliicoccales archaeon]